MPEELGGASAIVDPPHEIAPATSSFLDQMVDGMAQKELTRVEPGERPPPEPVETDDLDPSKETPPPKVEAKAESPPEDDELGIGKLIPKKKVPAAPPAEAPKADATKPAAPLKSPTDELKLPKGMSIPAWFRKLYDPAKRELDELKPKYDALEREVSTLKTRTASPEVEAKWKADLDNQTKRAEQAEENLRIVGYEKSPDFDRDHIKPLEKAWTNAFEQLVDQDIEVNGLAKKTSIEDVQAVVAIANPLQASRKARELFGDDAGAVLAARDRIREMEAKRDEALSTWKNKGTEHTQAKAREQDELQTMGQSVYDGRLKSYGEKYPEIWAPTDEKELAAQASLKPIIEVALFGRGVPRFNTTKEAFEFFAKSKADLAARAMATPVLLIRNATLEAKIAGLEEKLKGYEVSDPDVGNKGEGEGRKAPRREPNGGGGMAAAMAMIDSAPGQ